MTLRKTVNLPSFLVRSNTDHSSSRPMLHGRRAQRFRAASGRRQRFTLDGREHDGSLAISGRCCASCDLAASMLSSGAAHAEQESHTRASIRPFAAFVTEASRRFGVPEHWIRAVMHVESGAKPRARSSKGAMGLMQIMPKTWTELRARYGLGADPYDPHDNILAGAAYIRELHDRYGAPGFLAAYNAGPGRYERHLATGRPLPDETRAYVATLAPMINRARTKVQIGAVARSFAWANSSLFATRTAGIPQDGRSPVDIARETFFTRPRHRRSIGARPAVGQPVRTSYPRDEIADDRNRTSSQPVAESSHV